MSQPNASSSTFEELNDDDFGDPDTYALLEDGEAVSDPPSPRFGVLPPSQLPLRNGKRASRKRKHGELEQVALRPAPRKPPTKADKLVHHGRHYCRTIYAFSNVHGLITHGMAVENSGKRPEKQQERRAYRVYRKLLNLVPGLSERLSEADDEDLTSIARLIQRGANQARSDDTKGLKPVIIDWLSPPDEPLQPSLSRTVKVDRGFNHYRTGQLLCPPNINWSNANIQQQLRNKSLTVAGSDLPSFLWEDDVYDKNDIWKGFFRNTILVKAYKHIFTSPSSVDDVPKATRSGNARIHGMTSATPPSLAYVAVQVRFALASDTTFVCTEGKSEFEEFYETLLDIFEDPHQQNKLVELLGWYNQQVFPAFTNSKRVVAENSPYALFQAYSQSVKAAKAKKKASKQSGGGRRGQSGASSSKVLDSISEEPLDDEEDDENQAPNEDLDRPKKIPRRVVPGTTLTPRRDSQGTGAVPSTGRVLRSARQNPGPGLSY